MKRFNGWLLLVWLLVGGTASAQKTNEIKPDNIIILVDVSGSMKRIGLADSVIARVTCDVLHWQEIRQRGFVFSPAKGMEKEGGLQRKWAEAGKKVLVVPYGDIKTDETIGSLVAPTPLTDDLDIWETAIMRKWPQNFTDRWSYQDLARHRAADLARKHGFTTYWLFVVSDGIHEEMGVTAYSPAQQKLLADSQPAEVLGLKLGQINYRTTKANNFQIVISHVKLDKSEPPPPPVRPGSCAITLAKQGSKEEPISVDEAVNLTWSCSCPSIDNFTINVTGRNGTKVKPGLRTIPVRGGNSKRLPLEPGEYQITVGAAGVPSATTYVRVGSADLGWLWGLIVVVLAGLGLFWFLRNRKPKPDEPKPGPTPKPSTDISGGTGGTSRKEF